MPYYKRPTKADRKTSWMKEFSDHVERINPEMAGRINWDSAHHHYFTGKDPKTAAEIHTKTKVDESYKIHYPSLKKLAELQYTDPRVNTEGKKIHVEREGNFRKGDSNINGHYVVYEDSAFPGSYIGVHIGSELSEDTGEAPISVVAIDPSRSAVINRVAYRARHSSIAESDDGIYEEKMFAERLGLLTEAKRPVRFRELAVGDKFKYEDDQETMPCVKVSATHYKHDGVKYRMDNKSDLVLKEGMINETMPPSGWKAIDTYNIKKSGNEGPNNRYYSDIFNFYKTPDGKYVMVAVKDRKKPLLSAKTITDLIKRARGLGYKVSTAKTGGHWYEPGRDRDPSDNGGWGSR